MGAAHNDAFIDNDKIDEKEVNEIRHNLQFDAESLAQDAPLVTSINDEEKLFSGSHIM